MKRRIYTDRFVDKELEKIHKLQEKTENFAKYPDCMETPKGFDPFYRNKLTDSDKKEIKEYYKQQGDLRYIAGFWHGYSLALGIKEEK